MLFYIDSSGGVLQNVKISLVEQRGDTFTSNSEMEVARYVAALTNLARF